MDTMNLILFFSGLSLGLVYARLIPALLAIRQSRRKQARAWDAFEADADIPADYHSRRYDYHPGEQGNGGIPWYY